MKKTKTFYWIILSLFSAFMLFSAVPDLLLLPDALTFMHQLQYPDYFSQFLGIAKVLGIIAILIPGFPGIKEWAYAGLAFDLIGATYSQLAVFGFKPGIFFMALPIIFLVACYILYHKVKG